MNEAEFIKQLIHFKTLFNSRTKLSEAMLSIKKRVQDVYSIVIEKKEMSHLQNGYAYVRPFTDSYEEAYDYFETDEGKLLIKVLVYFGYTFKVPESQKTGYNLDPNISPE